MSAFISKFSLTVSAGNTIKSCGTNDIFLERRSDISLSVKSFTSLEKTCTLPSS